MHGLDTSPMDDHCCFAQKQRQPKHPVLQESYTQVSTQPCHQVCPAGTPVKEEHTWTADTLPSYSPDSGAEQRAGAQP